MRLQHNPTQNIYLREQNDTAAQVGQGRGAQASNRQWQQVEARAGVGSSLSIELVMLM